MGFFQSTLYIQRAISDECDTREQFQWSWLAESVEWFIRELFQFFPPNECLLVFVESALDEISQSILFIQHVHTVVHTYNKQAGRVQPNLPNKRRHRTSGSEDLRRDAESKGREKDIQDLDGWYHKCSGIGMMMITLPPCSLDGD